MTAQMKRQTAKKSQIEIETIAAEIGDLWRFTCEMQRTKFHLDKQDYSSDGPSGPCGVSLDVSCLSAEKEAEFRRDILKHSLSIAELKSPKDAVIIVAYMCSVFDWICECLGEAETYQDRSNKAEMERLLRNLLLYLEKQAGATVRQLGAEYFEYRHMCWEKEKTELRRLAKAHAPEAMEKAAKDFEAA